MSDLHGPWTEEAYDEQDVIDLVKRADASTESNTQKVCRRKRKPIKEKGASLEASPCS
jgi:hypothetical protein